MVTKTPTTQVAPFCTSTTDHSPLIMDTSHEISLQLFPQPPKNAGNHALAPCSPESCAARAAQSTTRHSRLKARLWAHWHKYRGVIVLSWSLHLIFPSLFAKTPSVIHRIISSDCTNTPLQFIHSRRLIRGIKRNGHIFDRTTTASRLSSSVLLVEIKLQMPLSLSLSLARRVDGQRV